MPAKTKKRPAAGPEAGAPSAPHDPLADLRDRCRYVEDVIGAALDPAAFTARRRAVGRGDLPAVEEVVAAYRAAYPDAIGDPEDAVLLLDEYVAARRDGRAGGLADLLEDFLNEDGARPRLDVLGGRPSVADVPDPAPAPKEKPGAGPGGRAPLPGRTSSPEAGGPPPSPTMPPPADDHVGSEEAPAEYDAEALASLRTDAATDAENARAMAVVEKPAGHRPWPAGAPVKYRAGKHWIVGVVVADAGDGRLTIARPETPGEEPWVVARSRCKRLGGVSLAAAPGPPEPAAEALVMDIPEADAARVAGWLALDVVPGVSADGDLAGFCLPLPGGGEVRALVVNGTPGACRPHVLIWVQGEDGHVLYEHPPQDQLLGRPIIAIKGLPVPLEIVASASGSA